MQAFIRFCWLLTLVGTVMATGIVMLAVAGKSSAPQEAAAFAGALCLAVIPYVFTRAMEGMSAETRHDSTTRIVQALHHPLPPATPTDTLATDRMRSM